MKINRLLPILGFVAILAACESEPKEQKQTKKQAAPKEKKSIAKPTFNADSAYHFVEKQVSFGPRVPNTEAHKKTAVYLGSKLEDFGLKVYRQKGVVTAFDDTKLNIVNIIGEYRPELKNRIMLFAHWDSRPFADNGKKDRYKPIDGANDGASGVGVLLEVARQLQAQQPEIGVDIMFFDAEDYGQPSGGMMKRKAGTWCLGSQFWARQTHRANYTANFGILLDMVGAANAKFTKEAISMYYAPHIVDKVWNVAAAIGHSDHFVFQQTTHVGEDDHLYINKIRRIPSIDIIQYDASTGAFAPHWHTHDDNLSVIDKETLAAVGETVLAVVLEEAK
ncbi:MAG: glutamine cyclotransferase [Flavobacteriales bacterium]|nr:glutamine cyclotransferase [Flavobacteriales bacterium]